jgi:hypothetical protein
VIKAKGAIVLHEGEPYERLEPAEAGHPFGNVKLGEPCALEINEGEGMPITGSTYVKDAGGHFEEEAVTHLGEEAQIGLGGLEFGVHAATIDGSANVALVGTHIGMPWGGLG